MAISLHSSNLTLPQSCRLFSLSLILIFLSTIKCSFLFPDHGSMNFTNLNHQLELLDPNFLHNWEQYTSDIQFSKLSPDEIGTYLFILGKMHLYGILPQKYPHQRSYLLAYYYLGRAAQKFQVSDAYYYLSLMEYMKLTPGIAIKNGLQKEIENNEPNSFDNQDLEDIIADIDSHHLHNIQHNLYLASLFGHSPSKVTLGYLFKDGIGTDKNCSAALAYYLSDIRQNRVELFQFPSDYDDKSNFQYDLYCQKKIDLTKYGQQDAGVLIDTMMFDTDSIKDYEDIALNYLSGQNGSPVNEKKAAEMFIKMQDQSKLSRIMLGFMYLKGRGVEVDYTKSKEIFEKQSNEGNRIAEETIIVMKYFQMGYKNTRKQALKEMSEKYLIHELREKQQLNKTKKETKREIPVFRTPTLKYLTSTLVLSRDILGETEIAVSLLEEAAKDGNIMAMVQMGLLFVDGADLSYDCFRAVEYFSKQALSQKIFQQRIELAKIGIKKNHLMFSFIKYVQLMMVGYKNAYINSLYLFEVYKDQVFKFTPNSWSLTYAKEDPIYRQLMKDKISIKLEKLLGQIYNPALQQIMTTKQIEKYMDISNSTIQQYMDYIKTKILTIGIVKHQISILKFFKYKKTKELGLLHRLADLGQNSPHILESRFLLGKYYQHAETLNVTKERREKRALEEYRRATKNKFLADFIFMFEGGNLQETSNIGSDFLKYLTIILFAMIVCYRQKNKRLEQILEEQQKKMMQGDSQNQAFGFQNQGQKEELNKQSGIIAQSEQKIQQQPSNLQNREENKIQKIAQQEEMINKSKTQIQKQEDDINQPVIIDDDQPSIFNKNKGIMIGSSQHEQKQHYD